MIAVTSATITLFSILILSPSIGIINDENNWNDFLSSIFHHLKWKFVIFLVENHTDIKEEIIVQLHDSRKSSVVLSVTREGLVHVPTSLDFLYEEEKSIKAVVDVNLETFKTFLHKLNKHPMLWSSNSYWLIKSENLWFLKDRNFSNLINKEINIAFTVFNNTKETFFIYSLNCEGNVGPLSFNVIDWNENASNKKSIFHKKPRYVKDLKGKKFKFALEKHFPFYLPPKNIKFPKPSGIDIYLLDILSRHLNFSYDIVRPADKKWGSKHNGTWNGMIGMIEKQEVHGALGGMSVIASRMEVADFSKSYAFDRIAFVIRSPEETSRKWVIFRPFTWDVWLAVTIAILVVAICLFVIENIIRHWAEIYNSRYDVKLKDLKIVKAILLIYKSVVYQDCYDPTSNSGRVLIVFWWIFVITLIAGYSGTLVSFMANPGREIPVDTISKLVSVLKSGQFSCGTISDSASHEIFRNCEDPIDDLKSFAAQMSTTHFTRVKYLQTSPSEVFKIILRSMESKRSNFVDHDSEGLEKCKSENYAYIAGELTTEADIEEKGMFLFSRDSFQFFGYGIAFTRSFWYRNDFDRIIMRLRYTGIIDRKIQKYIEEQQKYLPETLEERILTMYDLQGAFFVLLIGLLISIAVFIIELVPYIMKKINVIKD
ncbi:probable glutamate receptor [Centruroides vittatus]|uniref:probable glutamate receptor n=1 Tax=Centruroides vittatus TaxID=120091 RepID=UPI00350F0C37